MPARRPLLASLALVPAGLLRARGGLAAGAVWDIVTEYPATSMPGEGVAHFAAAATRLSAGALAVRPGFDAPGGPCHGNWACAPRPLNSGRPHAAAAAARHCAVASARSVRSVRREIRWRWTLNVL